MRTIEGNEKTKEGKLRRWVANLQLESWQLELLITGFSIFLLASGYDEYQRFKEALYFDKLVKMNDSTVIFTAAGRFVLSSIPFLIRFFLISLLLHLLLRGFWIGIVGLSSVNNAIDFEKLNLKGPFRKYLPARVRTLDDLIFFIDQISSVIFAYTYLLVFSVLSVALVGAFLFILLGSINILPQYIGNQAVLGITVFTVMLLAMLLLVAAIIFFLDTLLFSAFKKSRWFSSIYFPLYRLFSIISLSFIYRSIYYHLITNYKKKHIVSVSATLLVLLLLSVQFGKWDRYMYFPHQNGSNRFIVKNDVYDDERGNAYIREASIPSKIVGSDFLPLFIRYSPEQNTSVKYFCPEVNFLNDEVTITDGIKAGMASAQDTIHTLSELMYDAGSFEEKLARGLACVQKNYEVYLDDELVENDFLYTTHGNRNEKGFLQMLDLTEIERGKHVISIKRLDFQGNPMIQEMSDSRFKMVDMLEIVFWKE